MEIRLGDLPDNELGKSNDPLPEDRYDFMITEAKLEKSPDKGTLGLSLWCKVIGGEFNNKTRIINLWLTTRSLWKLQTLLLAIDYEGARANLDSNKLIKDLNSQKPVFSAWVTVKEEYGSNNFDLFTKASDAALNMASSELSEDNNDLPEFL